VAGIDIRKVVFRKFVIAGLAYGITDVVLNLFGPLRASPDVPVSSR
jgi:hypothetical protein